MYSIAKLPDKERRIIFLNTAQKMGIHPALVEKDFWVCLMLDFLFHRSVWGEHLAFKGGTSLSKAYGLIERFSEDIDMILDWRMLGYGKDEPWESRSNTKQLKFIDESRDRLFLFLKDVFAPELKESLSIALGFDAIVEVDANDMGIVLFHYPQSYSELSILPSIRLEIGALAAWTPTTIADIKPYVADFYQAVMNYPKTEIRTTTAERTFWEKATILHQEAQRPEGSAMPARYSRHYYDFYCMIKKGVLESALQKPELLEQVAKFKAKFYPRGWARYDLAKVGTLKLYPALQSIEKLRADYTSMQSMIFGTKPKFDEILTEIQNAEIKINSGSLV